MPVSPASRSNTSPIEYRPAETPKPTTSAAAEPLEQKPHEYEPERGTMRRRLTNLVDKPTSFKKMFHIGKGKASESAAPTQSQASRNAQINAERSEREKNLAPTPSGVRIKAALEKVAANEDAKLVMFGYSPTGGGHTGRTLNILEEWVKDKEFKKGDVLVAHVPSIWNGKPRPKQLADLARNLKNEGVTVLLLEAEKSVHGVLNEDGSSKDEAILDRIAQMPRRDQAPLTTIAQAVEFNADADIQQLKQIDANHLVDSIHEIMGQENMGKVFVLTDMDPALQKAAARYGVPDHQRVDQQNHPILLNLNDAHANLAPNMGVLGKVLGGHGEYVAYIGLGEKNTLKKVTGTAAQLGLGPQTSKADALEKVSDFLLEHALPIDHKALKIGPDAYGILHDPSIRKGSDVKNMVYVYANQNQAEIAKHIGANIDAGHANYKDTMFLFCGPAFKKGAPGSPNAMHMGYLTDADGITTAGAGTIGEFCYLHKAGGARSNFMAIPIEGHNEQEANAKYAQEARYEQFLPNDQEVAPRVTVAEDLKNNPLGDYIHTFMAEGVENRSSKYEPGQNLGRMLEAVGTDDTYPAHGANLLAGKEPMTDQEKAIVGIEGQMNRSVILSANRHFKKLVFQAAADLTAHIQSQPAPSGSKTTQFLRRMSGAGTGAMEIKLRKADTPKRFDNAKKLCEFLRNPQQLKDYLGDGEQFDLQHILLKNDAEQVFRHIAHGTYKGQEAVRKLEDLKVKFGHATMTGF